MCLPDKVRSPEATLCAHCKALPVRPEYNSSACSSYCGSACQKMAAAIDPAKNCQLCDVKPAYVENGHVHPYCGKASATKAAQALKSPTPSVASSAATTLATSLSSVSLSTADTVVSTACMMCPRPVYVPTNKPASLFCSNKCRQ